MSLRTSILNLPLMLHLAFKRLNRHHLDTSICYISLAADVVSPYIRELKAKWAVMHHENLQSLPPDTVSSPLNASTYSSASLHSTSTKEATE